MNKEIIKQETIKSTKDMLNKNQKCCLVRPTGFGKNYLAFQMAKEYSTVIFIYPRDIIKEDVLNNYKNNLSTYDTTLMTISYQKLVKEYKKDNEIPWFLPILDNEKTLIILDECHLACASSTFKVIKELSSIMIKSKMLGLTATPERADGKNPISDIFDNHEVFKYSLSDAIHDEIFFKPHYIKGTFEVSEKILEYIEKEKDLKKNQDINSNDLYCLNSEILRMGNLDMKHILEKYLNTLIEDKSYMKFMVFYPTISILNSKYSEIVDAFKEIFPSHNVNVLIIHSKGYRSNLKILSTLVKREYTIDLIFSVDMINLGYHIDDINGIIMNRPTWSDIIYKQQIGRCINIASKINPIIFDFVGNWKRTQYSINDSENNSIPKDTLIEETFGEDNIIFHDETVSFDKIDRIIKKYSTPEEELKGILLIVHAYLFLGAPIDFCTHQLKKSEKDFLNLVSVYQSYFDKNGNRIK